MLIEFTFNILASLVFGTVIGSFLNVVIWRMPRNVSLGGRSHCPNCKNQLSPIELFPLLSYLSTGGKCRQCKKPISARYPAIEALTGLLFVIAWLIIEPSLAHPETILLFAKALVVVSAAIVIFVIDFEHFLILDRVLLVVGLMVLVLNLSLDLSMAHTLSNSLVISGLLGGLGAGLLFFIVWFASKGKWMGFGDVKLVTLLGFIFGYAQMGILLLLSFWLGLVVSIILLVSRKANMSSKLPFGTFLSAATIIILFYGQPLLSWYLRLIGFPNM